MKIYNVQLNDEQRAELQKLVSTGSAAARTITRARILLLADAGKLDQQIVEALTTSRATVQRTRSRFVSHGLSAALQELPRSGRPVLFDGAVEAQLVTLACSQPPQGQARWSLRLLADRLVELEVVPRISNVAVFKLLKKTDLSPGGSSHGASLKQTPAS